MPESEDLGRECGKSAPRRGVRCSMKDLDCQVQVWRSFWKNMELLRAKINLRARRVKLPLMGRIEKGRGTQEVRSQGEKGRVTCRCL